MRLLIYIMFLTAMMGCKGRLVEQNIRFLDANAELMDFRDFIEEINFVQFEGAEKYLLSSVDQLVAHDDKWFVLDNSRRNALFIFDRDGRPINLYDRMGRAPGEYSTKILGFDVDPGSGDVLLLCGPKLILLDKGLKFKREIEVKIPYERVAFHDGAALLYSYHLGRVDRLSLGDDTFYTVFEFEAEKENVLSSKAPIFIKGGDDLYFSTVEVDKLFKIESGKFTSVATIDYPDKKETERLFKEVGFTNMSLDERMKYSRPRIMCVVDRGGRLSIVFNKIISSINEEIGNDRYQNQTIAALPGSTSLTGVNDKLVGWDHSLYYDKDTFNQFGYFDGIKINHLDKTKEEIDRDGNPVLIVYSLK
jgi:hypothetical protein